MYVYIYTYIYIYSNLLCTMYVLLHIWISLCAFALCKWALYTLHVGVYFIYALYMYALASHKCAYFAFFHSPPLSLYIYIYLYMCVCMYVCLRVLFMHLIFCHICTLFMSHTCFVIFVHMHHIKEEHKDKIVSDEY